MVTQPARMRRVNDLLPEMVRSFAQGLMFAEADVFRGAPWGQQNPDRVTRRNGYRTGRWHTRVGSIALRVPKLRWGSYVSEWLLDARTRSERAFVQVVTEAYVRAISTRRSRACSRHWGLRRCRILRYRSWSGNWTRPTRRSTTGPSPPAFTRMCGLMRWWSNAAEGGRVVNVALLLAVGVNNEGHRNILGLDVGTGEDGAALLGFRRSFIARVLSGVQLVTSDDHAGLRDAGAATLPGASWQRCRTHST